MYLTAILVFLVGSVLATPVSVVGNKSCSLPEEFQAVLLDISPVPSQYTTSIAYDGARRVHGSYTVSNTGVPLSQTVTYYNTMTQYIVLFVGPNATKCTKTKPKVDYITKCFTGAKSTRMGDVMGGLESDNVTLHCQIESFDVTLTLAKKGCVPLTEGITGQVEGRQVALLYQYTQFSKTITNEFILNIPPQCM